MFFFFLRNVFWQNVYVFLKKLCVCSQNFCILSKYQLSIGNPAFLKNFAFTCKIFAFPRETLQILLRSFAFSRKTFAFPKETLYLCCDGNNIRQKEKLHFCAFLSANKRLVSEGSFPGEFNPFTSNLIFFPSPCPLRGSVPFFPFIYPVQKGKLKDPKETHQS